MKLKFTILVFGICLFGIFQNSVFAEVMLSAKVQQFVNYVKNNNSYEASNLYAQLSAKEKNELSDYIENNSDSVPPVYYIVMADHIYKTNKDKAALWYYIGKFRSYQDILMCKDKTAQSQMEMYPLLAPKTMKYVSTKVNDKKYIADLMEKALNWDITHSKRVSPIWACYQGMGAFNKTPELLPNNEYTSVQDKVRAEIKDTIKGYKN